MEDFRHITTLDTWKMKPPPEPPETVGTALRLPRAGAQIFRRAYAVDPVTALQSDYVLRRSWRKQCDERWNSLGSAVSRSARWATAYSLAIAANSACQQIGICFDKGIYVNI